MKYLKRMKNEGGFSLVELMTAVGIIGVMSSVAVPKYQKFRANAAQSEAQSSLSSIYTLQQLYFVEKDVYASMKLNYTGREFTGLNSADQLSYSPANNARYKYTGLRFKATGATTTENGTDSDAVRFKAIADAVVVLASCASSGNVDKWCIDHDKKMGNSGTFGICAAADVKDGGCA